MNSRNVALQETGKNIQSLANLLLALSFVNLFLIDKISNLLTSFIALASLSLYVIGYKLIQRSEDE